MDQALCRILGALGLAAACAEGGSVTWVSEGARRFGVRAGMSLTELLPAELTPRSELRQFDVPALGPRVYAQAISDGDLLVLIFREDQEAYDAASLARTSRALRTPLNDILSTSRSLFERLDELEDLDIRTRSAKLNRDFYQLLRTANALSELDTPPRSGIAPRRTELGAWLRRLAEPAGSALAAAGRKLEVTYPAVRVFAEIDGALLEGALWCLLSNAVRYSPGGSTITLHLRESNGTCILTMRNPVAGPVPPDALAGGFDSTLTLESEGRGLGLGILRARRIIGAHEGALILELTPDGEFSANIRLPGRMAPGGVRSPLPYDRTGGYSAMLVELSEVLPDEVYDPINL